MTFAENFAIAYFRRMVQMPMMCPSSEETERTKEIGVEPPETKTSGGTKIEMKMKR